VGDCRDSSGSPKNGKEQVSARMARDLEAHRIRGDTG
jgi:hypothetical protein